MFNQHYLSPVSVEYVSEDKRNMDAFFSLLKYTDTEHMLLTWGMTLNHQT